VRSNAGDPHCTDYEETCLNPSNLDHVSLLSHDGATLTGAGTTMESVRVML
jgi:hypothetical protein